MRGPFAGLQRSVMSSRPTGGVQQTVVSPASAPSIMKSPSMALAFSHAIHGYPAARVEYDSIGRSAGYAVASPVEDSGTRLVANGPSVPLQNAKLHCWSIFNVADACDDYFPLLPAFAPRGHPWPARSQCVGIRADVQASRACEHGTGGRASIAGNKQRPPGRADEHSGFAGHALVGPLLADRRFRHRPAVLHPGFAGSTSIAPTLLDRRRIRTCATVTQDHRAIATF